MTTIVVDTETLEFVNTFSTGANGAVVVGPNPQVVLETSDDPLTLKAVRDDSGEIVLLEDPQKVEAKTAQAWTALRSQRNARLAATDWTQLADAHLSQEKKDAWAAYRQELRDLPDEVTDPTQVTWPAPPS